MVNAIVVLVTAPSEDMGKQIAGALLKKKLAACVNIIAPINSLYVWRGETCDDEEVLLIVKSRAELFEDKIIPAVKAIHPYDVPEIIALPVLLGDQDYLDWIETETTI
ncbi:MAG: divalent-cation tolerance protein CutA [Anaerolineales bacterium]|nr:divalent-cation tolerance protein CutA [Anaerolineales bacterium]MCK5430934.1 divalent-cation tolerance protein CutA [Anaerolineales bacterium]